MRTMITSWRYYIRRRLALWLLGAIVLTVAIGSLLPNSAYERYLAAKRAAPDIAHLKAALIAIEAAYEDTGRLYRSLEEYERSAYYPYQQADYTTCCISGARNVVLKADSDGSVLPLMIIRSGASVETFGRHEFNRRSASERTALMVDAYSAGVSETLKRINGARVAFCAYEATADRHAPSCERRRTVRSIPTRPFAVDFPRSEGELGEYERWLCACEGVPDLRDPWGGRLRFRLVGGRVWCGSAGPDGRWGTKDDVAATSGGADHP